MNLLKDKPSVPRVLLVLIALIAVFVAGRLWPRPGATAASHVHGLENTPAAKPTTYTCPMHPQIRQGQPGQCPICGMDLVPVAEETTGAAGSELPRLRVSARAAALMNVQTWPVERRAVQAERRFLGKIVYDETRLFDIVTRTEGQVEKLFVNYTGVAVGQLEHIAEFYSPEFFSVTQELLLAHTTGNRSLLDSARMKLRLLGVNDDQIAEILRNGKPKESFTLYSPVRGVLKELSARQGVWLMKGARLAQVADLSTVWVFLDAYESDLPLVHYGQQVELEVAALPGQTFTGFVAFIAPELDEQTRTVKVRLNVPNPGGVLRPGMFVRARLQVPLSASGQAYGPELAGKWICPMHPEIVQDQPGECPICGMPLAAAEKLGHVRPEQQVQKPLVIPARAPLITGKRAVVYVRVPNTEPPTFEGRLVELGPKAGEFYIVHSGLEEGELVVTEGNFKIDSELQLRGLPSLMSPATNTAPAAATDEPQQPVGKLNVPVEFQKALAAVVRDYLRIGTALAGDDVESALTAARDLGPALESVGAIKLETAAGAAWEPVQKQLQDTLKKLTATHDIAAVRVGFEPLSVALETAVARFGVAGLGPLYWAWCPMAFDDKGAGWLQSEKKIANPYFGSAMLRCGEIKRELK